MATINSNKAIKVYSYIRVSTETQSEKGYGLEMQENAIKKYCEENNLEIVRLFEDNGISGKIPVREMDNGIYVSKREGIASLLNNITNEINTVVMYDSSRLFREVEAEGSLLGAFRNKKVNPIFIKELDYDIYTKDPNRMLTNGIQGLLNNVERQRLVNKMAEGRRTKAMKGIKPAGRLPYGYNYTSDGKSVIVNKKEAKVVNRIFQLSIQHNSLQQIANILNKKGYTTRNNNDWSKQTINKMLNNDFYIGIITHAGNKISGKHDTIIDNSIWDMIHPIQQAS